MKVAGETSIIIATDAGRAWHKLARAWGIKTSLRHTERSDSRFFQGPPWFLEIVKHFPPDDGKLIGKHFGNDGAAIESVYRLSGLRAIRAVAVELLLPRSFT